MSNNYVVANGQKRCLGCMELYESSYDVCPFCGYAEETKGASLLHLTPGTLLEDRYLIGRTLGYGGFGVTYIAYDNKLERKVAIKEYLPSEYSTRRFQDPNVIIENGEKKQEQFNTGKEKFLEEGRKLAEVGNVENVVHMYDCFEANSTAYIVMEYLEGMTLAQYLDEHGILTQDEMLEIMLPVMGALSQVHELGIIHRDISPDNIFLTKDKEGKKVAKLIDFGAAKYAVVARSSKSLTVLVKKGYSPEEQYRSKGSQGTFTDVYALAAVMYKMLTGVRPPDALERRTNIETKKPDKLQRIRKLNKNVSENIENAILNGLNVKVEDRSATVDELVGELISYERVRRRGVTIGFMDPLSWPLWAKIAVPLSMTMAIVIILLSVNKIFTSPSYMVSLPEGTTRVPELISLTFDDAVKKSESVSLQIVSISDQYTPGGKNDIVLTQDLAYGLVVPDNSLVSVSVSTGKQIFCIPDVKGYDIEYARYALECMGLEVIECEGTENGLANNVVISQSIEPFTYINSGEKVTLTVNKTIEKSSRQVDFSPVGKQYEQVLKEAGVSNIQCRIIEKEFSDQYKNYEVIEASYDKNDILTLTVSIPMREFEMPNLNYKNQDIAVQLLKNIGIVAIVEIDYNDSIAENLVYLQDVKNGEIVKPNSEVMLQVSRGGKPFSMPSVIGLKKENAEKLLSDLKLVVRIEYGYSSEFKDGEVFQQSEDAGADVRKGDEIVLYVCSTEELISVENVVGKERKEAKMILEAQNLLVQIVETYDDIVEKGCVISQLPESGTFQKEGTPIVLTVSKGTNSSSINKGHGLSSDSKDSDRPAWTEKTNQNLNHTSEESKTQIQQASAWSSWATILPNGVTTKDYDIEQEIQYRSRRRETITSTQPNLEGWILYDQTEAWSDYGEWSNWSTDKKESSESMKVRSKTQYSIKTRSTTTSNTSTMNGWTLYDTNESWSDYGTWSSWTEQPATADEYTKVESKKQYRYQDKTTTTSTTTDTISGWTLYDTTEEWGPYGEWSSWSTNQLGATTNRKEESKNQYRYRDKETTTSTNSSLSGWTLYDTKEEWGPYGEWSHWSGTKPTESESTKVESARVYRYRDKETTTSTSSSLSGWTQTGSKKSYTEWSSWSSWGDSLPNGTSSTDTYQVESRTVYMWSWFQCENCGSYEPTSKCNNCKYTPSVAAFGAGVYLSTPWSNASGTYGGYNYIKYDGHKVYDVDRYTKTEYRYRTRGQTTVYTYERWGEWSEGQYDPVTATSTREVQTAMVYRYATREKVKTYYYYRWGSWSSWQDSVVSQSSTREVEKRTVYRYATREKITTYYFYKWSSWSNWGDTAYTQSSTRNVETRTVYRSCKRSKVYTYYFEKWSDWSEWGDTAYTANNNREVRTRNVYAYATRTKQYTYYYEKWGQWSNYSSTPIVASDNVDVQTRVVYRYRRKAK